MLRKYAQVVVRKVGTHVSQNNVRWSIALAQLQSEHTWTTMLKFSEYQHTMNCPMLAKKNSADRSNCIAAPSPGPQQRAPDVDRSLRLRVGISLPVQLYLKILSFGCVF